MTLCSPPPFQENVFTAPAMASRLAGGSAGMFPTDTLPALAALARNAAQLWRLKVRPADKPLILMGAELEQLVDALGVFWQEEWLIQARAGWPGPLTLVLPIPGDFTQQLNPGGAYLGLRVPASMMARDLLRHTGPLATTSVNRSGDPPATNAEEAAECFPQVPRLGPLPWPDGSNQASTVLRWGSATSAGPVWEVLREGGYKAAPATVPP